MLLETYLIFIFGVDKASLYFTLPLFILFYPVIEERHNKVDTCKYGWETVLYVLYVECRGNWGNKSVSCFRYNLMFPHGNMYCVSWSNRTSWHKQTDTVTQSYIMDIVNNVNIKHLFCSTAHTKALH